MAELTEKFCQYFGRLGQKKQKKGLAELAWPSWFWPSCLAIISSSNELLQLTSSGSPLGQTVLVLCGFRKIAVWKKVVTSTSSLRGQ
jgi:hypothetical protein